MINCIQQQGDSGAASATPLTALAVAGRHGPRAPPLNGGKPPSGDPESGPRRASAAQRRSWAPGPGREVTPVVVRSVSGAPGLPAAAESPPGLPPAGVNRT
jgi:hypothetical protein